MTKESNNLSIKRERFIRIAERRVNQVLEALDRLENCSNAHNYQYEESDARKIFLELERRLKEVKQSFSDSRKPKDRFSLTE
jgi:hypothetical protein